MWGIKMNIHPMRRSRQRLAEEESLSILKKHTHGILALCGKDGFPYAVPLSHVYHQNSLYFHCAMDGYKIQLIQENPHASFCVVDQDEIVPEEFTTYFRSVIAFGDITCLENEEEKKAALQLLGQKFAPGRENALNKEIASGISHTNILKMEIHNLSGKEALELSHKK